MSSSGSREASAKSQVSAASQHMKAVMASAQTMCDAADKEYKEAKAALEEAEKKYEVIDIDADDLGSSGQEAALEVSINKRKKTMANSSPTSVAISSFPREVTVVGCGLPEVNGIYLKEDDGDSFPTYKKQGMWKRQLVHFKLTGPPAGGLWFISYGLNHPLVQQVMIVSVSIIQMLVVVCPQKTDGKVTRASVDNTLFLS